MFDLYLIAYRYMQTIATINANAICILLCRYKLQYIKINTVRLVSSSNEKNRQQKNEPLWSLWFFIAIINSNCYTYLIDSIKESILPFQYLSIRI